MPRYFTKDPRTVARDIPGVLDLIFPQLTPGIVAHFNGRANGFSGIEAVPDDLVKSSLLTRAMLFEVAVARGEQLLEGTSAADWEKCLEIAIRRQKRHFDAKPPDSLAEHDIAIAEWVGTNLAFMLDRLRVANPESELVISPTIPGFQWIVSGNGDFSLGAKLIEVKCTSKRFGSADFRQTLMYWLLSYAATVERNAPEWKHCVLLNPRQNRILQLPFDDIIEVVAAGRSKVEVLELFASIVGDDALRTLPEFRM